MSDSRFDVGALFEGGAVRASSGPGDGRLPSALEAQIVTLGSACVALSGGVDSSLVLAAAAEVLGPDRVVAFTAASELLPPHELAAARALAASLSVEHVVCETDVDKDPVFAANGRDRCYICKRHMLRTMSAVARDRDLETLADGVNHDDLGDVRPGLRAADEYGVAHPLLAAGIGKAEVRSLAKRLGLATWGAPQQACLASRIPYGQQITLEKLRTIAAAEGVLRELGFAQCRVRHHGSVARIEVESGEILRAAGMARAEIVSRLTAVGFTHVSLDLTGFRSGSLNEG